MADALFMAVFVDLSFVFCVICLGAAIRNARTAAPKDRFGSETVV